jgi:hypothetical protein
MDKQDTLHKLMELIVKVDGPVSYGGREEIARGDQELMRSPFVGEDHVGDVPRRCYHGVC